MMERIGVLVRDGVVINRIVWADHTPGDLANDGYDHMEEITHFDVKPGIGWIWDAEQGYRVPSPYPSWVWGGIHWEPPVAMPTEGGPWQWNETTKTWDEIPQPEQEL